jgi:hypothetical protein
VIVAQGGNEGKTDRARIGRVGADRFRSFDAPVAWCDNGLAMLVVEFDLHSSNRLNRHVEDAVLSDFVQLETVRRLSPLTYYVSSSVMCWLGNVPCSSRRAT